ncbi:MAG: hypothetical protein ACP5QR_11875 [Rhizomicrobium sp.]
MGEKLTQKETRPEVANLPGLLSLVTIAAIAQIILGGVRFVDGGALMMLAADGFHAHLKEFSQYLFDSPLKIGLIHALRLTSATSIGIVFLALNALPVLAILLLGKSAKERVILLAIFGVLPTWKIMFQNVGIGDSVVLAGSIILIIADLSWFVAGTAALLTLWHFQQGVFICAIVSSLLISSARPDDRIRAFSILRGLLVGALMFFFVHLFISPNYSGRAQFMLSYMGPFLIRNIIYLPVGLACVVPGALLAYHALQCGTKAPNVVTLILACFIFVGAVAVAILTTDVSRVLVLLTFPMLLTLTNPRTMGLAVHERIFNSREAIALLFLPAFVPILSWAGIDYYLWPSLLVTFHKYGLAFAGLHG